MALTTIVCHLPCSNQQLSTIPHCSSFQIVYHFPVSVISNCPSFTIVYHLPLSVIHHCLQSLFVIPDFLFTIICHHPLSCTPLGIIFMYILDLWAHHHLTFIGCPYMSGLSSRCCAWHTRLFITCLHYI